MSRFETLRMTRDEWLEFRRSHVGGSDVAAIMGLSPWRTAYQVWAEKAGLYVPDGDRDVTQRMEWGTRLEPVVARKFTESHPGLDAALPGDDVEVLVPRDRPWAMATLDGRVSDGADEAVLEIKTAHFPGAKQWGDDGTGAKGVPPYYLAQVNHYLSVTGWGRAYVAVLIDGYDYREYVVEADPEDVEAATRVVDKFWHDNVEAGTAPEVTARDAEMLGIVNDEPASDYIDGDALAFDLVEGWNEAKSRERVAKSDVDTLAARLKAVIGEHAGIAFPDGCLTWKRGKQMRFSAAALRDEDPDTYERFKREVDYQRLDWREI